MSELSLRNSGPFIGESDPTPIPAMLPERPFFVRPVSFMDRSRRRDPDVVAAHVVHDMDSFLNRQAEVAAPQLRASRPALMRTVMERFRGKTAKWLQRALLAGALVGDAGVGARHFLHDESPSSVHAAEPVSPPAPRAPEKKVLVAPKEPTEAHSAPAAKPVVEKHLSKPKHQKKISHRSAPKHTASLDKDGLKDMNFDDDLDTSKPIHSSTLDERLVDAPPDASDHLDALRKIAEKKR
jgi:hypothetical protein